MSKKDNNMTVDLGMLKAGDSIRLRNGEVHEVTSVIYTPLRLLDFKVYTKLSRPCGGGAVDLMWRHKKDGSVSRGFTKSFPGDIVEIVPATNHPKEAEMNLLEAIKQAKEGVPFRRSIAAHKGYYFWDKVLNYMNTDGKSYVASLTQLNHLLENDYKYVSAQEPKTFATFLVPKETLYFGHPIFVEERHEVGKEPASSVMVPGSEN